MTVGGYVVDIVRGELLIEIQTQNVSAIRHKLGRLAEQHPVRLVVPIAKERWIVKLAEDGRSEASRRKSPRRGSVEEVFAELVSIPQLLALSNFSLDLLLTREEEVRRYDGQRAWRRRGWVVHERRLLGVIDRLLFQTPAELAALLPADLPEPFTTHDLALAIAGPRWLAQKMAYCLREMDALHPTGRRGRATLYSRAAGVATPAGAGEA